MTKPNGFDSSRAEARVRGLTEHEYFEAKDAIYRELIEVFMLYQYRQDNPFPDQNETFTQVELYMNSPIFRRKVDSMVSGVMFILNKHL